MDQAVLTFFCHCVVVVAATMPFSQILKPASHIIDLSEPESEQEPVGEAIHVKVERQSLKVPPAVVDLTEAEDVPMKVEKVDLTEPEDVQMVEQKAIPKHSGRGAVFRDIYAPHANNGSCQGRQNHPCIFGGLSMPAPAAPSGLCDLCDPEMLETLYGSCSQRLTHLVSKLESNAVGTAFRYIRDALGEKAERDMQQRLARLRRRHDPARPKRGPRGPYKKQNRR